jgi:hypothetical protein
LPTDPFILLPPAASADAGWRIGTTVGGEPTWVRTSASPGSAAPPDAAVPPGRAEVGPEQSARDAAAVADALARLGYAGQGLALALPSDWCLVGPVLTSGLPRTDRKGLAYRLEEALPLAAEEVVADFVHAPGDADRAMGVCARINAVRRDVAALEAAGVAVRSIAPLQLLVAQGMPNGPEGAVRVVVCPDGDDRVSLVALDRGVPVGWLSAAAEPADVALRLKLLAADVPGPFTIETVGLDAAAVAGLFGTSESGTGDAMAGGVAAKAAPVVVRHDEPLLAVALRSAAAVLDGRRPPWVELRRDALAARERLRPYRRALNAALAAAAGLLLAAAVAAFVRAGRYEQAARADEAAVVQEVRAAFPGWFADASAADVRAALAGERRSAAARAGGSAGLPPQASRSALRTLQVVVGRLPAGVPIRVDQATFEESAFELTGRARGYDDVDRVAAAIRAGGLDVPPPQARRGPDGTWTFTLRGTARAAGAGAAAAGG